jgi:hypothetical protein
MGVYRSANNIIHEIIGDILQNETIMKYLVYDFIDKDPSEEDPILNPKQYLFNPANPLSEKARIFPLPKIITAEENEKTLICVYMHKTKAIKGNPYFKDYIICIDIISHTNLWATYPKDTRPLIIMDEINEMYAMKHTTNSIKTITPKDDIRVIANNKFYGYSMIIEATNINKDCKLWT